MNKWLKAPHNFLTQSERQTLPFGKRFVDGKGKDNEEEEEEKKLPAVATKIRTANFSHGEPALILLSYSYIG